MGLILGARVESLFSFFSQGLLGVVSTACRALSQEPDSISCSGDEKRFESSSEGYTAFACFIAAWWSPLTTTYDGI
jgi:hypothetical protein